jgi:phospholipid/cholesterol/gamma-HCH transport system substrate-binding protein
LSENVDSPVVPRRGIGNAVLGLLSLLVLVAVCAIVFSGLARKLLTPGGQRLKAVFANTALLAVGSPVRVHGVDVGTVTGVSLDSGARSSTVSMEISDSGALPIYRDATAQLEFRTVLGANYAVDLNRGARRDGKLTTGVIPLRQTTGQVEVDQLLTTFQSSQRQGLRTILAQLPAALHDRTGLGDALDTLAATSPTLTAGISAARGEQDDDLTRLVGNTAMLMHALQTPVPNLEDVVEGGAGTLATTAAREADIQQSIQLASTTLPQMTLTVRELNRTLGIADPLLARLRPVVPQVAPTVQRLTPTVTVANGLLQHARPLLVSLRPTSVALAGAARQGRVLLNQLTPSIGQIATQILPDLAKVYSGSGRATYEMIGPTLSSLDAAAASLDGVSHFVTLTPGAGERSLDTLPCQTYLVDPTATQLIHCESLASALGGILGELPSSEGGG